MRGIHFLLSLFCFHVGSAQTWTQMPDFPGTARDDAASFSIGDSIYVGTGMEVGWSLTNDWYRFDAVAETWSPMAPLPGEPRQYACAFAANHKGYVFGGLGAGGALNDLWEYDPAIDQWTQRSSLPAPGRFAATGVSLDYTGIGFVATGMLDGGLPTNEAWKYDATNDTWSQILDVPGPARHRAVGYNYPIIGFVVAGGADALFDPLSDAWHYSEIGPIPEWYADSTLPAPRYGSDARSVPMLIIGGATSETDFHDDVWIEAVWGWYPWPAFAGGPRRGGVIGWSYGANDTYYGTGLDTTLTRWNDWWKLETPLGIPEATVEPLNTYPNPGSEEFSISGLSARPVKLTITDAQGRMILREPALSDRHIDTGAWDSGLYLVTAIDENGRTYHARWIKQ